jgi:hypothetical protein
MARQASSSPSGYQPPLDGGDDLSEHFAEPRAIQPPASEERDDGRASGPMPLSCGGFRWRHAGSSLVSRAFSTVSTMHSRSSDSLAANRARRQTTARREPRQGLKGCAEAAASSRTLRSGEAIAFLSREAGSLSKGFIRLCSYRRKAKDDDHMRRTTIPHQDTEINWRK